MKVFYEYQYVGISGVVYHPEFWDGSWHLISSLEVPLSDVIRLCNISDDDALILALTYGS